MRIKDVVWDTVTITCEKDPSKNATLNECTVSFNGSIKSLEIMSWPLFGNNKGHTYAKAELLDMRPHMMTFKAHWWSSRFDSSQFDQLIPVKVHCVLNAAMLTDNEAFLLEQQNQPRA